jgi:hypothetical protein
MSTTTNIRPGRFSADYVIEGLGIPPHDYISLTYSNDLITQAVFKTRGAAGDTVATLAFTYDGNGNILTVTKS